MFQGVSGYFYLRDADRFCPCHQRSAIDLTAGVSRYNQLHQ